ncbi:hypothetical protein [Massilia genomosp. 1]|uniref:Uncharacterized protein n=1 Tax=Massilia genomosp. 1 TaxID=2609280 RepID=A0ABX0MTI8_9BURK|nr:hypothetical protein [Massilia genomosp. 1]NHZ62614.1 hypothetical protein [Massilia genomosp. 1]
MTETVQGSLDGVTVQQLDEGAEYDTVDSPRGVRLAEYHIKQGVAMAAPAAASLTRPARNKAAK